MLVLSRKRGEAVIVGLGKVTIVDIRGDKVRIGFDFDPSIRIDREEVDDAKRAELARKELSPAAP